MKVENRQTDIKCCCKNCNELAMYIADVLCDDGQTTGIGEDYFCEQHKNGIENDDYELYEISSYESIIDNFEKINKGS